jgi:hypothetical protein
MEGAMLANESTHNAVEDIMGGETASKYVSRG